MSGTTDAGRLLVRIEATTAQLRQQLQAAEQQVAGTAAKIDNQLKQADKAFYRLEEASKATQQAVAGLAGKLGPMGGILSAVGTGGAAAAAGLAVLGAGLVQVAKAGDEATATLAKLSSSTGGIAQATQVYEGLFRLSQQTGIAVAESAGAFSRFAVAAKEIGGTNAQVLQLVSGIQKAGIVAGASAQEAGAAVQQLAQALASGKLQGDELRSLLENMPQLAQALAKELGVGIGRLREMGTEGKLTADVVFPALLRATEKISEEFDKMPMTIGRAGGALTAAVQNFGAELDKALGLSQRIAAALKAAADAINGIQRVILPTERQAAEAAALSTRQRADELRQRLSDSRDRSQFPDGPAGDRLFAAARANEDPRMARDVEAAEQAARDAEARLQAIRREARELERVERDEAARQALEASRQQAQAAAEQLRLDLDKDYALRKKHEERIKIIERAEATGAITSAQAAAQRKLTNDDLADGLKKLADAHKQVGKEAADADAHVKEYLKDQERIAKEAAKAQEQAAEAIRKYHERSFDAVVSIGERAFERLGDAMVDAFVSGQGAAVNFGNVARGIAASVVTDFAKLAIVNPILNSLFVGSGGPRPTLSAAFGGSSTGIGMGDLLGLSSLLPKDGLLGSLGISGSGIGSSIFGTAGTVGGSFADLGGITIAGTAGTPGLLGTYGTSLMGGSQLTLGGAFGSIGGGLAISSLLNSALGRSSAQSTNGMIGSGLGGLAGFLIGGPLGGLIGGTLGGLGGGLIGPGESVRGYGFRLQSAGWGPDATPTNEMASSLLPISRQYYNESGAQMFAAADQLVAATNAYLAARGLTVGGVSVVGGNKNGADYSWADAGNLNEAFTRLRFGAANDNQLAGALTGKTFSDLSGLQQFVEGFSAVRDTIRNLTETPAQKLARQLEEIGKQFDDLSAKAKEYGLSEEGLADARQKALDAVKAQQNNEGQAIRAYLDRLSTNDPSASPVDRFAAAQGLFGADLAAAQAGDATALARITSSADTLLGAGRAAYASGPQFAALRSMVVSSLESLPAVRGLPASQQPIDMVPLIDELAQLKGEVASLKDELRTARLRAA
jgi:tape measure domain-containing protein